MLIWDDAQSTCQNFSNDVTTTSLTIFKLMMNLGYKYIFSALGREVTQKTKTAVTVADQQYYQMPPDFLWIKSITITVGTTIYPIQEIEDQEGWSYLNQTSRTGAIPERYFIRPRFGVGGTEIGIFPIPSTADYTITIVYEASEKDLSRDKYTTSTVTITNGSATVTGVATTFTKAMIGRYFQPTTEGTDEMWYRIGNYTSALVISLENYYEGETTAGASYQIAEAFHLPEEMQILPVYYALQHYYAMKKDEKQEGKYKVLFDQGLELGRRRYATKSRGAIVRTRNWLSARSYPSYFPESIS